MIYLLFRRR
jgi:hypothetical protein